MKNRGPIYTILYAAVLGATSAALLTAGAAALTPYKNRNVANVNTRSILQVLGMKLPVGAKDSDVAEFFARNVRADKLGDRQIYSLLSPPPEDKILARAIYIEGIGIGGKIAGFLSWDPRTMKIIDIVFTEINETPTYGGVAAGEDFRSRFRGRLLIDPTGRIGVRLIKPGTPKGEYDLDAISGATITSDAVEKMINSAAEVIVQEVRR